MIRIFNSSKGRPNEARISTRTNWGAGTAAFPILIDMAPGAQLDIPDRAFNDWDPGVKQWLAEYMSNGLVRVATMDAVHHYLDKGHNPEYGPDYLIDASAGTMALTRALAVAGALDTEMQLHFDSLSVHDSAVGTIAVAAPTDLTELIAWLGAAATAYSTNHRPSAPAHPNADTVNTFTSSAADLADSIQELKELHGAFSAHKVREFNLSYLGIAAVLAY